VGVILWELRAKVLPEAEARDTIGLVSVAFVRDGHGDEISSRTTHVVTVVAASSDGGSIPPASTNPVLVGQEPWAGFEQRLRR